MYMYMHVYYVNVYVYVFGYVYEVLETVTCSKKKTLWKVTSFEQQI